MKKKVELYIKDIIRGRRRGILPSLIKVILLPLSWLYRFAVYFRNSLYESGWMRRYVPPVPLVISVGNIVAGGTGKTPVTLLLAGAFYERFTIAILSRGYRSKAEKLDSPVVLCEGEGPILPATYCGDEPYLFAQRMPKSIVIVGGNRKKGAVLAAKAGAQVILLDDGMQHRHLVRDFEVIVVDVGDPFGQGYFLPRGFLREDKRSLARADLIILNHIQDTEQFISVKTQLKSYSHSPVIGTKGTIAAIRDLKGKDAVLEGDKIVGMFCAIAHPEYFRRTLEQEGFTVINEWILADHDHFKREELTKFALMCLKNGAKALICTEKDRVKLEELLNLALPIFWVQLQLHIVAGEEEWLSFLKEAESKIK
ncbi:MAG: tetraacyldisaccharide 4'-kinase [Parachlamydiaceae bacterium]